MTDRHSKRFGLFLRRCEGLKFDVTFMSAGPKFVGVDGWRRLSGWHGPTPHVFFETGGGEDKHQADAVFPDVFEAYPRLSGKENHTSGMDVVFFVVQSDVCGACLDQQDLILLKMLMPGNHASRGNVFGAKHKMFRAIQALTVILVSSESGLATRTPTSSWPTARAS